MSGVLPEEGSPPPSSPPDILNFSLNRPASPPDAPQVESPQPRIPPSAAFFNPVLLAIILDATNKMAGRKRAVRVELLFQLSHDDDGIAGLRPNIELRLEGHGTSQDYEPTHR